MPWSLVQVASAVNVGSAVVPTLNNVAPGNLVTVQLSYVRSVLSSVPPAAPAGFAAAFVPAALNPITAGDSGGAGVYWQVNSPGNVVAPSFTVASAPPNGAHATIAEWTNVGVQFAQVDAPGCSGTQAASSAQARTSGAPGTNQSAADLQLAALMVASSPGASNAAITDPPAGWASLYAQSNTLTDLGTEHAYVIRVAATPLSASWSWTDATTVGSTGIQAAFFIPPPPQQPYGRRQFFTAGDMFQQ